MKKTGVLVLALLAALALMALPAQAEGAREEDIGDVSSLTGLWTFASATYKNVSYSREKLEATGLWMELTLRQDGTGEFFRGTLTDEITYSASSRVIHMHEGDVPFALSGDLLYLYSGDVVYLFARGAAPAGIGGNASLIKFSSVMGVWRLDSYQYLSREGSQVRRDMDRAGYAEMLEINAEGWYIHTTYLDGYVVREDKARYQAQSVEYGMRLVLDGGRVCLLQVRGDKMTMTAQDRSSVFIRSYPGSVRIAKDGQAGPAAVGDLAGYWRLREIRVGQETALSRETMDEIGYDEWVEFTTDGYTAMTFYENGVPARTETYTFQRYGDWVLLLDERSLERFQLDGDTLTISGPYVTMIFGREELAQPDDEDAPAGEDTQRDDGGETPEESVPSQEDTQPGEEPILPDRESAPDEAPEGDLPDTLQDKEDAPGRLGPGARKRISG